MKSKIEQSIRLAYSERVGDYEALNALVSDLVEDTCKQKKWLYVSRIKELESYSLKLLTGRTNGFDVDDFLACTIVVHNLNGIQPARELVLACFDVAEEKPGEYVTTRPAEFNFDGIRLYCSLRRAGNRHAGLNGLSFEVQIKTLLEYAWGEATHDFSYKGDNVSWARERLAAQVKAVLSNADLSIYDMEEISKSPYLNKKNKAFEDLCEILDFIKRLFGGRDEDGLVLPADVKRLAEQVQRLLDRVGISLNELEAALNNETAIGRGFNIRNLSIYSLICVSLFHQYRQRVVNKLSRKPSRRGPNLVILSETGISSFPESKGFECVTFL